MTTYRKTYPGADYVAQSRVVTTGGASPRYSLQLLRRRSRHGDVDSRGWGVFVKLPRLRLEVGSR